MSRVDLVQREGMRYYACSWALARNSTLRRLLAGSFLRWLPPGGRVMDADALIGWGRKASGERAAKLAADLGLPCYRLEDGFFRSFGPVARKAAPLSLVVDRVGIHYDASCPSELENLLREQDFTEADLARARHCREVVVSQNLTKYNTGREDVETILGPHTRRRVLVVDQVRGDMSVAGAGASTETFAAMLSAARRENPGAQILIKRHPDVVAKKRKGCMDGLNAQKGDILLAEDINSMALVKAVDRVYTVSSQLGFEALLAGTPVICFGVPFYAGWGLTDDRAAIPARRSRPRSVDELFAAACLYYCRYFDPNTLRTAELEDVLNHLVLQKQAAGRIKAHHVICVGIPWWKKHYAKVFLGAPGRRIEFASVPAELTEASGNSDTHVAVWGMAELDWAQLPPSLREAPLIRMEDGFLRSHGLGSDLVPPMSLVADTTGIYFDATHPSDLEKLLNTAAFDKALLERARGLQERIVSLGVGKYNVGDDRVPTLPAEKAGRVILVVGQVEGDVSLRRGAAGGIHTDLELIRTVRARNPDAWLIYKPHPDVVSGNREGDTKAVAALADQMVTEASLAACLKAADEVHVMTSLAGFEALLIGRKVVVYGHPFYAGWGLTEDINGAPARRTRPLTLDELVAGALILYPSYFDWERGHFTTPERVVEQLAAERAQRTDGGIGSTTWPVRQAMKLRHWLRGRRLAKQR